MSNTRIRLLLASLLLIMSFVSLPVGAYGTVDHSDPYKQSTTTYQQTATDDVIRVYQGDIARIPIRLETENIATVSVHSLNSEYRSRFWLSSSDQVAELHIDTLGGNSTEIFSTPSNNSEILSRSAFENQTQSLVPGFYLINITKSSGMSQSILLSVDRPSPRIASLVAPESQLSHPPTEEQIYQTSTVAKGDHAIIRIRGAGLDRVFSSNRSESDAIAYSTPSNHSGQTLTIQYPIHDSRVVSTIMIETSESLTDMSPSELRVRLDSDRDGIFETTIGRDRYILTGKSNTTARLRLSDPLYVPENSMLLIENPNQRSVSEGHPVTVRTNGEYEREYIVQAGNLGRGYHLQMYSQHENSSNDVFLYNKTTSYNAATKTGYVVVPTSDIAANGSYTAMLSYAQDIHNTSNWTDTTTEFTVVPASAHLVVSGQRANSDRYYIRGETTLSPGTAIEVAINRTTGPSFLIIKPTTVNQNGHFNVSFDRLNTVQYDGATVQIRHNDKILAETTLSTS